VVTALNEALLMKLPLLPVDFVFGPLFISQITSITTLMA